MKKIPATCPNCSHDFTVTPPRPASRRPAFLDDVEHIVTFESRVARNGGHLSEAPSRNLYGAYLAYCPDLPPMTLRRFSTALLATGRWDWRAGTTGRLYRQRALPPLGDLGPGAAASAGPVGLGGDGADG